MISCDPETTEFLTTILTICVIVLFFKIVADYAATGKEDKDDDREV